MDRIMSQLLVVSHCALRVLTVIERAKWVEVV